MSIKVPIIISYYQENRKYVLNWLIKNLKKNKTIVKNFIFKGIIPTTKKEEDLLEEALEALMKLLFDFEIALCAEDGIKKCKLFDYEKEAIKDALELLPQDLKLILNMHIIEALTPEEIAKILDNNIENIQAKLIEAFTTAVNQFRTCQFVRKYYQTKDDSL